MTEENVSPRVVRRSSGSVSEETEAIRALEGDSELFTNTLSSGRVITLREMTAGDLLYLEKGLGNVGDMERSLKLAVRLSTGAGRISYEDLQKLKMRDLKVITALLAKMREVSLRLSLYSFGNSSSSSSLSPAFAKRAVITFRSLILSFWRSS